MSIVPVVASADYLDNKITELTAQKLDKIATLEECQKKQGNLKIAGITTLGISTIGIAANIGEAVHLKNLDTNIATKKSTIADLDAQIAAEDTCGKRDTCDEGQRESAMTNLYASSVICIDGQWKAEWCLNSNSGTEETCKSQGQAVKYYTGCQPESGEVIKEAPKDDNESAKVKKPEGDKEAPKDDNESVKAKKPEGDKETPKVVGEPVEDEKSGGDNGQGSRKYHELCSAAETAEIPLAQESWWFVDKCVAKSCKSDAYLTVKEINGVNNSQGKCQAKCEGGTVIDWIVGGESAGKACVVNKKPAAVSEGDKDNNKNKKVETPKDASEGDNKTTPETPKDASEGDNKTTPKAPETPKGPVTPKTPVNCERSVFIWEASMANGSCYEECERIAKTNNCKLVEAVYDKYSHKGCICNPTAEDKTNNFYTDAYGKPIYSYKKCPENKIDWSYLRDPENHTDSQCESNCYSYSKALNCEVVEYVRYGHECWCNTTKTAEDLMPSCKEFTLKNSSDCEAVCREEAEVRKCKIETAVNKQAGLGRVEGKGPQVPYYKCFCNEGIK